MGDIRGQHSESQLTKQATITCTWICSPRLDPGGEALSQTSTHVSSEFTFKPRSPVQRENNSTWLVSRANGPKPLTNDVLRAAKKKKTRKQKKTNLAVRPAVSGMATLADVLGGDSTLWTSASRERCTRPEPRRTAVQVA